MDVVQVMKLKIVAAREARDCFNAALLEGFETALADGNIELLRDLWMRRMIRGVNLLVNANLGVDPRDPDPSRSGIFRDHNCWKCEDGAKPCAEGNPHSCPYPHARND